MIWIDEHLDIDQLNKLEKHTLAQHLSIQFTERGPDYLKATMPVNANVHQPMGILHGGASAALAETVGSMAGWLCLDQQKYFCVGLEINCNHVKAKRDGLLTATARPLHLGKTTQVWDIKIEDEGSKLVCVSRLTLAVIAKAGLKNS